MWGIIAGTGFERSDFVRPLEELDRSTPFGEASSGFKRVKVDSQEALFLPRHGMRHELLPSEINYRANIYALKRAGATKIISISAVGSLKKELEPGHMVVPFQYIDRTKGIRRHTFAGEGLVAHVSLAHPISPLLASCLLEITDALPGKVHFSETYVCIEGPCFSTQAESHTYRDMGASIIGMTNFPEFALAREAALAYLPCCFVTDYDCWDESVPHVTVEGVMLQMQKNNRYAFAMIPKLMEHYRSKQRTKRDSNTLTCDISRAGLVAGLLTDRAELSQRQAEILETLAR